MTRHWLRGALAILVIAAPARTSMAQSESDSGARHDLLDQATRATEAGDHARALDLATRAGQLSMTTSLRAFIAGEQIALGRVAEAYGMANQCVHEAERDPSLRDHDAILQSCREFLDQLRTRVGHVSVQIPSPMPPGVVVHVAGVELNRVFYGVPYLVTPGDVEVLTEAPGWQPFRRTVHVAIGASVDVPVTLQRGPGEAPTNSSVPPQAGGSVPLATAANTAPIAAPAGNPPSATSGSAPSRVGPAAVIGVGAAALIAAAVFAGLENMAVGTLTSDGCTLMGSSGTCPSTVMGVGSDQATFSVLTDVFLAVGVVAVAAGAIALAVQPSRGQPRERSARLHWLVVPASGGAIVGIGGAL